VIQKKSKLMLIGPEGDFSEEEVNQALDLGYEEVSLGSSRLRTETAGLMALARMILKE
jgi:16S rRNA (uracil1498-N3)-methyltransferase